MKLKALVQKPENIARFLKHLGWANKAPVAWSVFRPK
jgi:membrane-bound lytic murein transglycosylase B